jgi:hypothetical protein
MSVVLMAALSLRKILAVTEFLDFLTAILLLHMAAFLLRGMASAFFGRTGFPLHGSQFFNIGGKSVKHFSIHIVVHEIALLFTGQKSCISQHFQMLGNCALGKLQFSCQRPDTVIMPEQQRQYFHSGLIGDCLEYKRFVHCISSFQDIIDLVITKSIISNTFDLVNTKLEVEKQPLEINIIIYNWRNDFVKTTYAVTFSYFSPEYGEYNDLIVKAEADNRYEAREKLWLEMENHPGRYLFDQPAKDIRLCGVNWQGSSLDMQDYFDAMVESCKTEINCLSSVDISNERRRKLLNEEQMTEKRLDCPVNGISFISSTVLSGICIRPTASSLRASTRSCAMRRKLLTTCTGRRNMISLANWTSACRGYLNGVMKSSLFRICSASSACISRMIITGWRSTSLGTAAFPPARKPNIRPSKLKLTLGVWKWAAYPDVPPMNAHGR